MINPAPKSSVWDHKPWWCQPWSILLTGIVLISGSWLIFQLIWVTLLVAVPVLVWMVFFIVLYPKLVAESGLLEDIQTRDRPTDLNP